MKIKGFKTFLVEDISIGERFSVFQLAYRYHFQIQI